MYLTRFKLENNIVYHKQLDSIVSKYILAILCYVNICFKNQIKIVQLLAQPTFKILVSKTCLFRHLCNPFHHCYPMSIFVAFWPFSIFLALRNPTPCLFRHKISLPVHVGLVRFYCIYFFYIFHNVNVDCKTY